MKLNRKVLKTVFIIVGLMFLIINLAVLRNYYPHYDSIIDFIILLGEAILEYFGDLECILSILGFLCILIGILISDDKEENNKSKLYYIIQIIIGLLPFIGVTIYGINESIEGFTFIFSTSYGLEAFGNSIIFISIFAMWPYYIIGLVLIIRNMLMLRKIKRRC